MNLSIMVSKRHFTGLLFFFYIHLSLMCGDTAMPIKNLPVVIYTNVSFINCCVEVTVKFNGTIPL